MKIKIALIITLCSLSTWAFAQTGNGGAVHSSGSVPAQTAPRLNRPNNVNPNNPNNPAYRNNTNNGFGHDRGMTNGFRSHNGMTNGGGWNLGRTNNFGAKGFTNGGSGYVSTNTGNSYSNHPHSSRRKPYATDPKVMGESGSVTNKH